MSGFSDTLLVRGENKIGQYAGQGSEDSVTDLEDVKESVRFCAELVPGSNHYDSAHESGRKSGQEYKGGYRMRMDDVPGNMVKPEQYPAQTAEDRSRIGERDQSSENFPVLPGGKCLSVDKNSFHRFSRRLPYITKIMR